MKASVAAKALAASALMAVTALALGSATVPQAATAQTSGAIPEAWTAKTKKIYAQKAQGRDAYDHLTYRAKQRKPGETLAIVLGIDHVALYDGPRVDATYRYYRTALKNGYDVYFMTGRGPVRGAEMLKKAGFTQFKGLTFCDGTKGVDQQAKCKAAARAKLIQSGVTLVGNVASNASGWKYSPQAERTVKLQY